MGLAQFEQRLERLVEGAFAKAYRKGLQPVEIGRRLTREMDLHRTVGVHGMIAPNAFTVALAESDLDRFEPFADALLRELADAAAEHAEVEGYGFVGPVEVTLERDPSLRPGIFLVAGEVREGPIAAQAGSLVLPDGQRIPVDEDPLIIGRLPGCSLVVDDSSVSRRHLEVTRDGQAVVVTDLGSTNGTQVNGAAVTRQRLVDGDRITLGAVTLIFEARGA